MCYGTILVAKKNEKVTGCPSFIKKYGYENTIQKKSVSTYVDRYIDKRMPYFVLK